jgi:hypothetical protein
VSVRFVNAARRNAAEAFREASVNLDPANPAFYEAPVGGPLNLPLSPPRRVLPSVYSLNNDVLTVNPVIDSVRKS